MNCLHFALLYLIFLLPISAFAGWESISSTKFVAGILARLGNGYYESCGFLPHDLIQYCISDVINYDVVAKLWLEGIPTFSKKLERPVNLDSIFDKIQEV